MGPIKGIVWIAEKVNEQVEKELYDEDKVRGQLMEMELRLDLGEISEEEYLEAEEVLLERLNPIIFFLFLYVYSIFLFLLFL